LQYSVSSHKSLAGRQTVEDGAKFERQVPAPLQVSEPLQVVEVVSPQVMPTGWNTSVGHAAALPVQVSAASQSLAAGRQTLLLGTKVSNGQLPAPSQLSATSQIPAAGRQVVVVGE
jgi:hypothetical protein